MVINIFDTPSARLPRRGIVTRNFSTCILKVVPKITGQAAGMVAWRLWRKEPLDKDIKFSTRTKAGVHNCYITGGYTLTVQDALNLGTEAAEAFEYGE